MATNFIGAYEGVGRHIPTITGALTDHFNRRSQEKDVEGQRLRERQDQQFSNVMTNLQAKANQANTDIASLLKQDDQAFQDFMSVAPVATRDAAALTNRELVDFRSGLDPFEVNPGQYALGVRRKDGNPGVITRNGTDRDDDPVETYSREELVDQVFRPAILQRGINDLTGMMDVALGGVSARPTEDGGAVLDIRDQSGNPIPPDSPAAQQLSGALQGLSKDAGVDFETTIRATNQALQRQNQGGGSGGGSGGGPGGPGIDTPPPPTSGRGRNTPGAPIQERGFWGELFSRERTENAEPGQFRLPGVVQDLRESGQQLREATSDGRSQAARTATPEQREQATEDTRAMDEQTRANRGQRGSGDVPDEWMPRTEGTEVSRDSEFDDTEPVSQETVDALNSDSDPLEGSGKVPLSGGAEVSRNLLRRNPGRVVGNSKYTLAQQATAAALFYKSQTGSIPANLISNFRAEAQDKGLSLKDRIGLARDMIKLETDRVGLRQAQQDLAESGQDVTNEQNEQFTERSTEFLDSYFESIAPRILDRNYAENEDAAASKAKYQFTSTVARNATFLSQTLGLPFDQRGNLDLARVSVPQLAVLTQMTTAPTVYDGSVEEGGWFSADQVREQFGQMDLSALPAQDPRIARVNTRIDQLRREDPENFGRMVSEYINRAGSEGFWLERIYQDVQNGTAPEVLMSAVQ